mmetsp:Transcript_7493/g.24885  ORF Transcript_7493/g.24885 Transcript_7493/m.24885 type:complete len:213 (-) Transcript_7493:140-778(-)|eukprot:CAMPEP_0170141746 /NCGR_PEP_ID=MMETSP0033_2-20121228/7200_1 /TAXON_ID=195969 /ORGANISM="Dolichomastix tenuilepis, Strain CCMP3274" /LENGTH=212 /DNA_ID=CAMNT_0010378029 /DNA_START=24 /DNA_END=662 /DNA_ORIENTATION=-
MPEVSQQTTFEDEPPPATVAQLAYKARRKAAIRRHDMVNAALLPVLAGGCLFGILGWADPYKVSVLFMVYFIADLAWILIDPICIPSLVNWIIFHHSVTILILIHPLRAPEHAVYTCYNGIVEISTLLLVLKRYTSGWLYSFMTSSYWVLTFTIRAFGQPYLIYTFTQIMKGYPPWEYWLVLSSQIFLVTFNLGLIAFQLLRPPKDHQKKRS